MVEGSTSDGPAVAVPVTDVPSTVATLRSLAPEGIHTVVVSEMATAQAFASKYCGEVVRTADPHADLLAYRDDLLDVAARDDVRTIVPVREVDAYVLSRYRSSFERHVSLPVPDMAALERVHDRLLLAETAEAAGVPVPDTRRPADVDDWSRDLLAKSRYNLLTETYDDSLAPGESATSDLIEHFETGVRPDLDSLRERHRVEPIVQEFVPGAEEYMVAALYDSGDPLAVFQHRQVRGTRYTGSGGAYRESVSIPELEAVATDLLDHLEWNGLACLEYLRDEDTGEFVLAEINPRMWQSLASTVAMGADFPRYYWQQATGRADEIDPSYDLGVGCHWLKGEFLHALSLFRFDSPHVERPGYAETLRDIAVSTYRQPRFDYLSLDDPGPFLQDCSTLLAELPAVPRLQVKG
ncbi:carboxylate--amine ligase [Halosimplex pelagicum]|uniref:Carboxylate--amine ligase n=1 Tax=Halosimplex pelagicum TaxID=869886 RepID=A0A7D5PEM8_9EURY|nr:carboxylate--amine ligase [Halosimplex pelagicum]QLH81759.1 carboxylate--amine ligase [Halosimplex pelagicum]